MGLKRQLKTLQVPTLDGLERKLKREIVNALYPDMDLANRDYRDITRGDDSLKLMVMALEPDPQEDGTWNVKHETTGEVFARNLADMEQCFDWIRGVQIMPCYAVV